MMLIRKLLDFGFTQRELKILDDVMPESSKRKDEEERIINDYDEPVPGEAKRKFSTAIAATDGLAVGESGNLQIALANGNVMKIPLSSVNITEEVNKTGIWKQVNTINTKDSPVKEKQANDTKSKDKGARKRGTKKDAISEEERRRLSTMNEEEEEDGLTIKVDPVV